MFKCWIILGVVVAFLAILPRSSLAVDAGSGFTNGIPLCVMSFNLKYASSQSPNSWQERRSVMFDCIRSVAPDLVGTQEGLYPQLKDLATNLNEYSWIGLGRDGGSHGEFSAIFYKKERFDPLEFNHFWLSDNPELIGSTTWGNAHNRMVTWVRFCDLKTGREFYFWNTHLDHKNAVAREKGADLIRRRIQTLNPKLPLVLTGDFNSADGHSSVWNILTKDNDLVDAWLVAREHGNKTLNSGHGYKRPKENGMRIDWILARGGVSVERAEVNNFSEHGQCPSDHFPVVAWLKLGGDVLQ